jgi:RNA-directed DNA polymerase
LNSISPSLIRLLSTSLVSGPWQDQQLVKCCERLLGRRRWIGPLVERMLRVMPPGRRPSAGEVIRFLEGDRKFQRACSRVWWKKTVPLADSTMEPFPGNPRSWDIPSITTCNQLAEWLEVTPRQLDWFTNWKAWNQRASRDGPFASQHYQYAWLSKRRAGTARLLETPKPRLKAIQKRILRGILNHIPAHGAAHGFIRGRSVRTYVEPHVGQAMVLRLDLRDFFPSVRTGRIVAIFRTAGYPEPVAVRLAKLCSNRASDDIWDTFPHYGPVWDRWRHEQLYRQPHLPQGAPTSPSLANLACFRLDCRLSGLARRFDARYTRYADDLLFSGPRSFATRSDSLLTYATAIAMEEGFEVHLRKTRRMPHWQRQQATGIVINQRPNVARDAYDRLKATLYNSARHGPQGENREGVTDFRAHLEGRISYFASVNPARAAKLQALFRQIQWTDCE